MTLEECWIGVNHFKDSAFDSLCYFESVKSLLLQSYFIKYCCTKWINCFFTFWNLLVDREHLFSILVSLYHDICFFFGVFHFVSFRINRACLDLQLWSQLLNAHGHITSSPTHTTPHSLGKVSEGMGLCLSSFLWGIRCFLSPGKLNLHGCHNQPAAWTEWHGPTEICNISIRQLYNIHNSSQTGSKKDIRR